MLRHVVILGCAAIGFFFLARGVAWYGPYIYDEADYMFAASQGWKSNAFDTPSMPLGEFLKTGLSRGRDPASKSDLSSLIRSSNDVLFYRHWHGPLYGYWLDMTGGVSADSRVKRQLNYVFAGATALLLYFGSLWVLEAPAGPIAALLSSILYLWSYAAVKSTELAPHQLFAFLIAAALLLLAKLFADRGSARKYWYGAVVMSALAFCVLEVAFALILTLLVCGWLARRRLKADWGLPAGSLAAFAGTVLIIWPGAVLKLSPVKSDLFMAYLALFRKAAWGDDLGFGETWWLRFIHTPVVWLLLLAAIVYLFKRRLAVLTPLAVLTALMFLATFRVTTGVARYELPLLPGVALLGSFTAALVLAKWAPVQRNAVLTCICAAMFITSWVAIRSQLPDPHPQTNTVLVMLRQFDQTPAQAASGRQVILLPYEHLPMVHYYLPNVRVKSYYDDGEISAQLRAGNIAGIVTRTNPPRWVPVTEP